MSGRPGASRGTVLTVAAAVLVAVVVGVLVATSSGAQPAPPPQPSAAAPAPVTSVPAPVTTSPAPPSPGRYVALGDSYTASPLTGPAAAGVVPGCAQSTNDYPHLVAAATGATLADVSCSGATTRNLAGPQATNTGTNPPQLEAVTPETTLVTLGIGGNDIGFAEIVRGCVAPAATGTPCRDRFSAGGTDLLAARTADLGPALADALAEIRRRAPAARVLVVGYPTLLPTEGPGCYPVVPYTPGDVDYLRGVLSGLDDRLRAEAQQGDATFVDAAAPSVGHDMCTPPGTKWVEGFVPASPALPVHPNALGSAATSRAVLAALGAG